MVQVNKKFNWPSKQKLPATLRSRGVAVSGWQRMNGVNQKEHRNQPQAEDVREHQQSGQLHRSMTVPIEFLYAEVRHWLGAFCCAYALQVALVH